MTLLRFDISSSQLEINSVIQEPITKFLNRCRPPSSRDPKTNPECHITGQCTKKITHLEIISEKKNDSESKLELTLAQGIAKGEKMDFLIQKAVELGVTNIIPMQMERCVVRLKPEKIQKKINHWQKIANQACEQSGRSVVVNISLPKTLKELLDVPNQNGFVLHHKATSSLTQMKKESKATILIGPEGGLTDLEITDSTKAGYKQLLLGKRVLRTETASLVAIANMQLLWGS